eukprot:SAG31_NODE_9096_length_1335_cov_1.292071_1_plen_56_part_00
MGPLRDKMLDKETSVNEHNKKGIAGEISAIFLFFQSHIAMRVGLYLHLFNSFSIL